MSLVLYYLPMGPPSRTVLLAARALDVSLDLKLVDLMAGENYTEEFLKSPACQCCQYVEAGKSLEPELIWQKKEFEMNPQHCVPLLADGDLYLSESSAIIIYLAEQYGKDDALYPKDPKARAVINQRLFFSDSVLWPRTLQTYIIPVIWKNIGVNDLMMDKLDDAFNILNTYLDGHDWVAGDEISLADYGLITRVTQAQAAGYDVSKYDNIVAWIDRCKETMEDYEDLNQAPVDQFSEFFQEKLSKIESLID